MALVAAWECHYYWIRRWAQDDAYISFRYAKHFVAGHGLVYNLGDRVEGYSNFLWTLLSAVPLALGAGDPLTFMHALSLVAWLGVQGTLLAFLLALARRGLPLAPLALLPLLGHWSYNVWFFSGMETPLVCLFVVLACVFAALEPARHRYAPLLASTAGTLLMMTRADGAILWLALAVAAAINGWSQQRPAPRVLLGGLAAWLAPVVLLYLPYTAWRLGYYGSFFPNTYYAKAAYLPDYSRGWIYLRTFLSVYREAWLLPLVALAAPLAPAGPLRRFLVAVGCVAVVAFAYVVRIGGDFMEWRFLVPVLGVLYPALVLALTVLAGAAIAALAHRRLAWTTNAALVVTVCALWLSVARSTLRARITHMEGQEVIGELERYCNEAEFNWGEIGVAIDKAFPKSLRLATGAAGIIPFLCDRWILDLHGLNDRQIAYLPIDPAHRGRMGHDHFLEDLPEMRRRGADVLLLWPYPKNVPLAATGVEPEGRPLVSMRLPDERWVEFIVLDSTKLDLARMRHDSLFVVSALLPPLRKGGNR